MKELPIRKFTTVVGFLTEPTYITNNGEVIGQFLPKAWLDKVPTIPVRDRVEVINLPDNITEAQVDDIKRAIEPDRVKESRGRLSKGLGEIPGQTEKRVDPQGPDWRHSTFGESKPAPKPKK